MYVGPQMFAAANGRPACRTVATARLPVYVRYFPAHCADVANMFPHYNLSPAVKTQRRHRCMRCSISSVSQKRLPACWSCI